jgi:uncharacterized membrane protein HdeD (DUF308 family)
MAGQGHFTATLSDLDRGLGSLWRSRAIPGWACIAVGVGGFTHPFLSSNHIVVAVGFCVLAAGYAASASSS